MRNSIVLLSSLSLLASLSTAAPLPAPNSSDDLGLGIGIGIGIGSAPNRVRPGKSHHRPCPEGWTRSLVEVDLCIEIGSPEPTHHPHHPTKKVTKTWEPKENKKQPQPTWKPKKPVETSPGPVKHTPHAGEHPDECFFPSGQERGSDGDLVNVCVDMDSDPCQPWRGHQAASRTSTPDPPAAACGPSSPRRRRPPRRSSRFVPARMTRGPSSSSVSLSESMGSLCSASTRGLETLCLVPVGVSRSATAPLPTTLTPSRTRPRPPRTVERARRIRWFRLAPRLEAMERMGRIRWFLLAPRSAVRTARTALLRWSLLVPTSAATARTTKAACSRPEALGHGKPSGTDGGDKKPAGKGSDSTSAPRVDASTSVGPSGIKADAQVAGSTLVDASVGPKGISATVPGLVNVDLASKPARREMPSPSSASSTSPLFSPRSVVVVRLQATTRPRMRARMGARTSPNRLPRSRPSQRLRRRRHPRRATRGWWLVLNLLGICVKADVEADVLGVKAKAKATVDV